MLTPIQLESNFRAMCNRIREEYLPVAMEYSNEIADEVYANAGDFDSKLTQFQWDNLVKTCSVISANYNRFSMNTYHDPNGSCGTTHCIAGWAISLAMNDTNCFQVESYDLFCNLQNYNGGCNQEINKLDTSDSSAVGGYLMSDYVRPFFHVVNLIKWFDGDMVLDHNTAENLMMEYLINPVLEEAKRESYELTNEVYQFIERAKSDKEARKVCPI